MEFYGRVWNFMAGCGRVWNFMAGCGIYGLFQGHHLYPMRDLNLFLKKGGKGGKGERWKDGKGGKG